MKIHKLLTLGFLFANYLYAGERHLILQEHELPPSETEQQSKEQEQDDMHKQSDTDISEESQNQLAPVDAEFFTKTVEGFLAHKQAIADMLELDPEHAENTELYEQLNKLKEINFGSVQAQARIKVIITILAQRCAELPDAQIDELNAYLKGIQTTPQGKRILAQLQQQMVQEHMTNTLENAKMGLTVGFLAFNVISSFVGLACEKFAALAGGIGVFGKICLVGATVFHTHRALVQARREKSFVPRTTYNKDGEQTFITKASDFVINSGRKIAYHARSVADSIRDVGIGTKVDSSKTASDFNTQRRTSRANQARIGLERSEGMLSGAVDAASKRAAQVVGARTRVDQYSNLISEDEQREPINKEEPSADEDQRSQEGAPEQDIEVKNPTRFDSLDGAQLHTDAVKALEDLDTQFPELRENKVYQAAFAELMVLRGQHSQEPLDLNKQKVSVLMQTVISEMAQEVQKLSYDEQDVLLEKMNIDNKTGPLGEINTLMQEEILKIDAAKNRAALKSFLIVTAFIGLCVANFFCPIIGPVMLVSVGIVIHSLLLLALSLKALDNYDWQDKQNSTGKKILHAYRKGAAELASDVQGIKKSVADKVSSVTERASSLARSMTPQRVASAPATQAS